VLFGILSAGLSEIFLELIGRSEGARKATGSRRWRSSRPPIAWIGSFVRTFRSSQSTPWKWSFRARNTFTSGSAPRPLITSIRSMNPGDGMRGRCLRAELWCRECRSSPASPEREDPMTPRRPGKKANTKVSRRPRRKSPMGEGLGRTTLYATPAAFRAGAFLATAGAARPPRRRLGGPVSKASLYPRRFSSRPS